MLRVTDDILEVRRWAEERGGRPCRDAGGRVGLCFGADPSPAACVGWDEFETNFEVSHDVLVYDDAPGCSHCFIGTAAEARAYVERSDPRSRGAAKPTP